MRAAPQNVLIYVGLDLVGDGLLKLPFLRILKANWPSTEIVWCAGKGPSVYAGSLRPLVAGLLSETLENAGFGSCWADLAGRPLAGRRFALVLDTQRRLKTTLAVRRLRHDRFISGTLGFLLSDGRPRETAKPRALQGQLLQLLEAAGGDPTLTPPPLALPQAALDDARHLLPPGPVYIGFAPGAGGRHKCWPVERYVALAAAIARPDVVPVFILGPDEREWIDACRAVPGAVLPLQDAAAQGRDPSPILTIALAQRLSVSVANDAGGGHMLALGDGALISLFGPTDPAKFAPAARIATVIRAQDFGGTAMDAIPLGAVLAALQSSLQSSIATAGPR